MDGEIMQVAEALPAGLVDHIVAGHVHQGIAHVVNGVSITASYSSTRAFSRTDLRVARNDGALVARELYPPQPVVFAAGDKYEGIALRGDATIARIAGEAVDAANAIKNRKLGVTLTAPFELVPDVESALSNLMTEAMLDSFDADIAIHNVFGGIRSGLPAGQLTYGTVYQMFPFDNVVTIHQISGRELREIVARKAAVRRKPGFAGMRAIVRCGADGMEVTLRLDDGRIIHDTDTVRVIANDFLALGGDDILTPAIPAEGLEINQDLPLTRDTLVRWFETNGGTLDPADFRTHDNPKWQVLDIITESCTPNRLYSVSRR
jgi:2',3'-cyclic-nucleotide 2'-phosphodiesterase (5'-nucleotidase family)